MIAALRHLLTPRPRIDTAALNRDVRLVSRQLRAIERHLLRVKDADGHAMCADLHEMLEQGLLLYGPAIGADVAPFSGGGPKPE